MKIEDVMHRNVEVIATDATVREAAQRMSASNIGVLPVCVGDRIAGMLTDRDIVVRSIARGDDPDKRCARDIMTRDVERCHAQDSLDEASQRMADRQIQRLLVMDENERLVGIVSIADLARARGDAPVAEAMAEIKAPTKPSAIGFDGQQLGR